MSYILSKYLYDLEKLNTFYAKKKPVVVYRNAPSVTFVHTTHNMKKIEHQATHHTL